jgi:hypothetical protein
MFIKFYLFLRIYIYIFINLYKVQSQICQNRYLLILECKCQKKSWIN